MVVSLANFGNIDNPFAITSPWNTPIASDATYQPKEALETASMEHQSGSVTWIQANAIGVYRAKSTDPLATWTYNSHEPNAAWQFGAAQSGSFEMRTPADLEFHSGDGWAILVSEDGQHFIETWLGEQTKDNTYHAQYIVENTLDGTGVSPPGGHDGIRAGGTSLLGGLVTAQDLDTLNIDHAVALSIATTMLKSSNDPSQQYVGIAQSADAGSTTMYTGSIPMGAMFAIPQNVDLEKSGIKTPEGMALAKAFQTYGGYVADATDARSVNLATLETGATQNQVDNLFKDMDSIRALLQMVTSNPSLQEGGSAAPAASSQTNIGFGSDQIVLKISQDAYQGDAQFTISVDGRQIGGTLIAHAAHADGQSDTVTVNGEWGAGRHIVSVNFLNDAWGGSSATDRNLYVDGATYNGAAVSESHLALMSAGAQLFAARDAALPVIAMGVDASSQVTTHVGSGADQIVLKVSQDAYLGDAQFTISVDGRQVGGTLTAHAAHADGQSDMVTVNGEWGTGNHSVSVNFLNDAWGGSSAMDRNLYVDSAAYNGTTVENSSLILLSAGSQQFTVPAAGTGSSGMAFISNAIATTPTTTPNAPSVALTHDTSTGGSHTSSDGLITYTLAGSGDTLHYRLDSGLASTTAPVLATDGSADGQHTLTVYETNAAGLTSADASLVFTLDTHHTTMTTSSSSGSTGSTATAGQSSAGATGTGTGSGTTGITDSSSAASLGSAATPNAPSVALTHDTSTGGSHTSSDGLITYTLASSGDTLHYRLDSGPASTTAPVLATDGSADGQHTLTVYETNAAGLTSADASLVFTLDTHHITSGAHFM